MSLVSALDPSAAQAHLDRILATIPSASNRGVVVAYLGERRVNGIRMSTLAMDANALRGLAVFLGEKDFSAASRADIYAYLGQAAHERAWRSKRLDGTVAVTAKPVPLSQRTLAQRKVVIRAFYKWLAGGEAYPDAVATLKTRAPSRDSIPTEHLLTSGDVRRLLQAHPRARDKALIAVLYESGMRASELCAINVGSVEFDEYGAVITLPREAPGLKTGARRIRLLDSTPYLHAWYEAHPRRHESAAPLFYGESRRRPGVRMNANGLFQFVTKAARKAGLAKKVHPHLFRHSAATERARLGWTENMMRAYFGWSRSSDMPATYVHLAGQDYEEMELERRGLKVKGERAKGALAPLKCRVCGGENLSTAMFCQSCRNPVSPAAEEDLERRRQEQVRQQLAKMFVGEMKESFAREVVEAMRAASGGTT